MLLIHNNPFRVSGILANASARDFEKQKAKFKAYSKVGKEIRSELDYTILNPIIRTSDSIEGAYSKIEHNGDRVSHSLFWFINASPFDKTALDYLKAGDQQKASEIWERVTFDKEVSAKNYSAFNNLGTYKLLSDDKLDRKNGVTAKIKLIESEFFEDFIHAVADKTYTVDSTRQVEKFIDELYFELRKESSTRDIQDLFSGVNGYSKTYLSKKLTEQPLHNIEQKIELTKNKRKEKEGSAFQLGNRLYSDCKSEIIVLKELLGTNDIKYKNIADQLANEILQCGIDYFNNNQDHYSKADLIESSLKLTRYAESVAIGTLTKDRIKDSVSTLSEMKDEEINQAVAFMQSIEDTYNQNEADIMAQVRVQKANLGYGQSINWSKVNQFIKNSIDWSKVVEFLLEVIPRDNVDKIKSVRNQSKLDEYKRLVNFVFDKMSYSQQSRVSYICFWSRSTSTRPSTRTRTTTRTGPSSTQSSGGEINWLKVIGWGIAIIIAIRACAG